MQYPSFAYLGIILHIIIVMCNDPKQDHIWLVRIRQNHSHLFPKFGHHSTYVQYTTLHCPLHCPMCSTVLSKLVKYIWLVQSSSDKGGLTKFLRPWMSGAQGVRMLVRERARERVCVRERGRSFPDWKTVPLWTPDDNSTAVILLQILLIPLPSL